MCGIVGMLFRRDDSGRLNHVQSLKDAFTKMLVSSTERGRAATGIVVMSRENSSAKPKALIFRAPLSAEEFVKTDEYKKIMNSVNLSTLSIVGHTRAVSGNNAGAENNYNNHPHLTGDIIGVHNGRVINDHSVWAKYAGYMSPRGNCDSEVIFALVNRKLKSNPHQSTAEAFAETIRELKMWFSIALIDIREPGRVYLAKDWDSTPLELMTHIHTNTSIFASKREWIADAFSDIRTGYLHLHHVPQMAVVTLDVDHDVSPTLELSVLPVVGGGSREEEEKLIGQFEEDFKATQGH